MPERLSSQRPSEPRGTTHTAIGTIKWWKPAKGYGAIECADTTPWDIWFHYSTLESPKTSWEGGVIEPGFTVEVEFHRADQESFSYIADVVRPAKP